MGVLPMVWASFLSRTCPGVGGALMYRANEPMVHAKLAQLSLLWCWPADRSGAGTPPYYTVPTHTRSSGGSGGEERWVASLAQPGHPNECR